MADFIARFPRTEVDGAEFWEPIPEIFSFYLGEFPRALAQDVRQTLFVSEATNGEDLQLLCGGDGASWIIAKGVLFHPGSSKLVDLQDELHRFCEGDTRSLTGLEGTFVLAAWDATRRQGLLLNDQASSLNAYYADLGDAVYVGSTAFPIAKATRRGLSPSGVRELMGRGAVIAPTTLFDGIYRLAIGECVRFSEARLVKTTHWTPWVATAPARTLSDAAIMVAEAATTQIESYAAAAGGPLLFDITGGLDSRLLVAAADKAKLDFELTVTGEEDSVDVKIGKRVAGVLGRSLRHVGAEGLNPYHVTEREWRRIAAIVNGELPMSQVLIHRATRPSLSGHFAMHAVGIGGDFVRYHPWGQEFLGLGKRRLANVDNVLQYRLLQAASVPENVFSTNWFNVLRDDLRQRVTAICEEWPNARTTQQLDAVHLWKLTGHTSLYLSSLYNWLPTTAPLQSAGFVETCIGLPWRHRLTTQLQRAAIQLLSPKAAAEATAYGSTGAPLSIYNAPLELRQVAKRSAHLIRKVAGTALRRAGFGNTGAASTPLTFGSFQHLVTPSAMNTSALYDGSVFLRVAAGSYPLPQGLPERFMMRAATVEQLAQELSFIPTSDFLSS